MKDKIQQAICVLLVASAVYLWAARGFWVLFMVLFVLHFLELLIKGWRVGRLAGKSAFVTVMMTLICGYTWWLPIEKSLSIANREGKSK